MKCFYALLHKEGSQQKRNILYIVIIIPGRYCIILGVPKHVVDKANFIAIKAHVNFVT